MSEPTQNQILGDSLLHVVYTDVYGKALLSEARRIHTSRPHPGLLEQFTGKQVK